MNLAYIKVDHLHLSTKDQPNQVHHLSKQGLFAESGNDNKAQQTHLSESKAKL